MNLNQLVSDPYNRRARLQPALLIVLPVLVIALLLFPDAETRAATILGVIAYFGGAAFVAQQARELGRKLEPKLYDEWGGKPSVALLRHSDATISSVTKKRYYDFLADNIAGFELPTSEQEQANHSAADESYKEATDWIHTQTAGPQKSHPLFE